MTEMAEDNEQGIPFHELTLCRDGNQNVNHGQTSTDVLPFETRLSPK